MKRAYFVCLFLCLTTTFLLSQSNPVPPVNQTAKVVPPVSASQANPKAQARVLEHYGKLPLSFEVNHGQTDGRVKFLSRTSGYTLFLTGDEAVLALSGKKIGHTQSEDRGYGPHFAVRHRCAEIRWRAADEAPQCQPCGQGYGLG